MPTPEHFSQTTPLGQVAVAVTRHVIDVPAYFNVPYEGADPLVRQDFPDGFSPSFGSGLAFKGIDSSGDMLLYCLTDRGPNGDGPLLPSLTGAGTTDSKIFPAPGFTPAIGIVTVGVNGAVLAASTPIRISATLAASGLPLPQGTLGNSGEIPLHDSLHFDAAGKAVFHEGGIDSEAIAFDRRRGVLWVTDEYGPFLMKIDPASGLLLARYAPGSGLPSILAKRRPNRGMEGMTYDSESDTVHAFLQSPLSDGDAHYALSGKEEKVERFAAFLRWVVFDPQSESTLHMLAYPLDPADFAHGRTGNAKLGDMVALGGGKFIVIEQGESADGGMFNKLMLVEVANASDILGASFNSATSDLEKSSMSGLPVNGANWAGVVPLKKTLLLDLNAIGWLAEKAEGLALIDGSTLALTNDNDFGMLTKMLTPAGVVVAEADVTKCNVDAAGKLITTSTTGCADANTIRVGRGLDKERPSRLWLLKFARELSSY